MFTMQLTVGLIGKRATSSKTPFFIVTSDKILTLLKSHKHVMIFSRTLKGYTFPKFKLNGMILHVVVSDDEDMKL